MTSKKMKKRGLGERGLNALLAGSRARVEDLDEAIQENNDGQMLELPIDVIQRGVYQPRRDMDTEALEELALSIKQQGVMQPIVVRPISKDKYEIIAGERRWRATQLASLEYIPAIIRDVPDEAAIAMSLIENIQRENLNPIEEAIALKRLQDEFTLTQQQVADAVGKSRSTITNLLRLMELGDEVKTMLEYGDLEMGHARALLTLTEHQQLEASRLIVGKGLSVRQTEALVRKLQSTVVQPPKVADKLDPDIERLQNEISERVGAAVKIDHGKKGKGRLIIQYNTLDELDGILSHIG